MRGTLCRMIRLLGHTEILCYVCITGGRKGLSPLVKIHEEPAVYRHHDCAISKEVPLS